MCQIYTLYWRCCKGISSRITKRCKYYDTCNQSSKFYQYLSHECPTCEAKSREKEVQSESHVAASNSRLKLGPTTRPGVPVSNGKRLPNDGTNRHPSSSNSLSLASVYPDRVTIEAYSPPPSPKGVPICDTDNWATFAVPETPEGFQQLFEETHPGWDGKSDRNKEMDARRARKG